MTAPRVGSWQQTYTGRQFWTLDPRPEDFDLRDITHALSLVCRFGGHVREFYSVGQHCVLVADWCYQQTGEAAAGLAGLMHDAAEAYCGDMVYPLKRHMQKFQAAEQRIHDAIRERFGVSQDYDAIVREGDLRLLATEARDLMATDPPASWELPFPPLEEYVQPWGPQLTSSRWYSRFVKYGGRA